MINHIQPADEFAYSAEELAEIRFKNALQGAEIAFFAAISAHYPEIKTGDLNPADAWEFSAAAEKVAKAWIKQNTPA